MSSRTKNNPSVEIHEVDRSNYDSTVDNSTVGTATLVPGFFNTGEDCAVTWINSIPTLHKVYGYPTNDAETYSYNACTEVLNGGGVLYVAKLPYDNRAKDMISFCSYKLGMEVMELSSTWNLINRKITWEDEQNVSDELGPATGDEEEGGDEVPPTETETITITHESDTTYFERLLYPNVIEDTINQLSTILGGDFADFIKNSTNFTYSDLETFNEVFLPKGYANLDTFKRLSAMFEMDENALRDADIDDDVVASLKNIHDTITNTFSTFGDALSAFGSTVSASRVKEAFEDIVSQISEEEFNKGGDAELFKTTFEDLISSFTGTYCDLANIDPSITSVIEISSFETAMENRDKSGMTSLDTFDRLKTGELKVPLNEIRIYDITHGQYRVDTNKVPLSNDTNEYLGLIPVITTAPTALMFQGTLGTPVDFAKDYNPIGSLQTVWNISSFVKVSEDPEEYEDGPNHVTVKEEYLTGLLSSDTQNIWSTGKEAASYFPKVLIGPTGNIDRKYLKQVGLVVFEAIRDSSAKGKVTLVPRESFVGSLNKDERDPITKQSIYLGNIVNANSNLINLFTNIKFSRPEEVVNRTPTDKASTYIIRNQAATSLGFFSSDRLKNISVKKSILDPLDLIFENSKNPDQLDIDILLDAGVSNIAQFIASTKIASNRADRTLRSGYFDLLGDDTMLFSPRSADCSTVWRMVIEKYKNFCQYVRKDCMFICDGLRSICLTGNQKVVRRTAPKNTVENSILPYIKSISGINSSYGAGYCNWFWTVDAYTKDLFWCPPSIKALGRYLHTDNYSSYWNAPAGLNRGVVRDAVDISFYLDDDQAGYVYGNSWNYATSYPMDGIAVEGQRTFQVEKTALDRVNVRRLMLGLEKQVRRASRYFIYESLTDFTVGRFRDAVTAILANAEDNGGVSDYFLVCDDSNNSIQTMERHELHATIAVKPILSLEWLIINFVSTSQGADVEEVAKSNV